MDADEIRAKHCKEKWTAEKRKEHSIKISKARSGMKFSEEHKHNIGKSSMGVEFLIIVKS